MLRSLSATARLTSTRIARPSTLVAPSRAYLNMSRPASTSTAPSSPQVRYQLFVVLCDQRADPTLV